MCSSDLLAYDQLISKDFEELNSFVIYMGVEGNSSLKWEGGEEEIALGEAVVIPNIINNIELKPSGKAKLLEIYLV